jgi:hypothetical protein
LLGARPGMTVLIGVKIARTIKFGVPIAPSGAFA